MTAPKTSPAMGPEQQGRGGDGNEAQLGLVIDTDREQVLGTCSPALLTRLESIKASRLTAPEKFAVGLAIQAVIDHKPSEYMAGVLAALCQVREHAELAEDCDCCDYVYIKLSREVWNELQEVQ